MTHRRDFKTVYVNHDQAQTYVECLRRAEAQLRDLGEQGWRVVTCAPMGGVGLVWTLERQGGEVLR